MKTSYKQLRKLIREEIENQRYNKTMENKRKLFKLLSDNPELGNDDIDIEIQQEIIEDFLYANGFPMMDVSDEQQTLFDSFVQTFLDAAREGFFSEEPNEFPGSSRKEHLRNYKKQFNNALELFTSIFSVLNSSK
jgi:hypothetical protein